MRFEAEEFGSLDDVAILKSDQTLSLVQVKHVTERTERPGLSLDDLLEREGKRSRSLFEKWFQSWLSVVDNLQYRSIEAVLYTNRPPAEDFAAILDSGTPQRIDSAAFRTKSPITFESFRNQAGKDAARLDAFLETITFRFNSADIEPAEHALRGRANDLNISSEGFAALLDQIWDWSTRRGEDGRTVEIGIDAVKRACGWRKVEKLSEAFPVARDYVPLGGNLVESFAQEILSLDGSEFILSDVPGAGKSTFLAKLSEYLRIQDVPCIRHHYFLAGDDDSTYERLNSRRTADALIAELEAFTDVSVNPGIDKLKSILTTASDELRKNGRKLVVLLDGLDHVLRTEDEDELTLILKQLLPPPPNLSIVFGTRRIPSARVRALLEHIPSERRYHVPRMSADDCKAMLLAHPAVQVPEHALEAVSARLAQISEGLPLHAHYSVVQLEGLSRQGFIMEDVLDQLVPYGGDLQRYYETIWQTFNPETKILAIVLAVAGFPVPPAAMPNLFNGTATELQRAIESLKPFINETFQGLTLFHASFQEFVADHADTVVYRAASLERLIEWLRLHAKPSLRWRWLHAKEFQEGNPQPLIESTSREWIIASIKDGHSSYAIEELLRLACHAAMTTSDYSAALSRGMSADQLEYSFSSDDNTWNDALSLVGLQRLDRVSTTPEFAEFRHENSDVLLEFAQRAPVELLPAISDELFERFEAIVYARQVLNHRSALEGAAKYYVNALAIARSPLQVVVAFINRFNLGPARFAVSSDYIAALLSSKQFTNAALAVDVVPVAEDQRILLREKLAYAGISQSGAYFSQAVGKGLWGQLYNWIVLRLTEPAQYQWPQRAELPLSIEKFNDAERALLSRALHSAWLNGLLAGAAGDHASLDSWLTDVRRPGWTGKTAFHIASMGFAMGQILVGMDIDLCVPLSQLDEVDVMTPGDPSWEDYELWISYKRSLLEILHDCLDLRFKWQQKALDNSALSHITSIPGFEEYDLYKLALSCDAEMLPREVIESFVSSRLQALQTRLEQFPERAEAYLEVATLARRSGALLLSENCLRKAINNLLGYGNHKDIFLYELLRSLELALQYDIPEVPSLLDRVALVVNVIGRVTDGDETDHLVEDFAGISMQLGSSAMAGAIYQKMMEDERYYQADSVFAKIAEFGKLSDIWVRSLLRTSIDSGARHHILKRAELDDDAASLAADMMADDHDPALVTVPFTKSAEDPSRHERGLGLFESVARTTSPEDIPPDQFINFCTEHRDDHYMEGFSERWWDYWVLKSQKAAYDCVTSAMEQRLIRSWSGNLELRLLPSVLDFEGSSRAFESLIGAARGIHVWNSFYTQAEKTETVFGFLLKNFPKRIDEFIQRTVESGGYRSRMGPLPVRRGAQFLFKAGRSAEAVKLIVAGVERLIDLMANLELPIVCWTREERNVLDALFARLFHVHPEVRSNAAQSLGELLLNTETCKATRNEFETRLSTCLLESQLVTLLYPIAYARRRGYVWPDPELMPHLKARSTALDMVLGSMQL